MQNNKQIFISSIFIFFFSTVARRNTALALSALDCDSEGSTPESSVQIDRSLQSVQIPNKYLKSFTLKTNFAERHWFSIDAAHAALGRNILPLNVPSAPLPAFAI